MPRKNITRTNRTARRKVEFQLEIGPGHDVGVAGSFNNWENRRMVDRDGDGIYRCVMLLEPGHYEYKFIVDGEWKLDDSNPNFCPNSLGTLNSVLVLEAR